MSSSPAPSAAPAQVSDAHGRAPATTTRRRCGLSRRRSTSSPTSSRTCLPAALDALAGIVPVRPGRRALEVGAGPDRREGLPRRAGAGGRALCGGRRRGVACGGAGARSGAPAILKTRRLGYDGKGQARIAGARGRGRGACVDRRRRRRCWRAFVAFEREISVIAARGLDGAVVGLRSRRERASRRHPAHDDRAGGDPHGAGAGRGAAGGADPDGARLCRRDRRRALRHAAGAGRQRDRAAGPQFRALDDRRLPRSTSSSSMSGPSPAGRSATGRGIRTR